MAQFVPILSTATYFKGDTPYWQLLLPRW